MAEAQIFDIVAGILTGTAAAFAAGGFSAAVTLRRRQRAFERIKREQPELPAWLPKLDLPPRSKEDKRRDEAMQELLASVHREAKAFQDQTLAQLVATSATLLGAFVGTALSVTLWRSSEFVHFASAAFDVVAVIYAFLAFRRSGHYRAAWLRQRCVAELLRQWFNVEYVLAPSEPALTAHVENLLKTWDAALKSKPGALMDSATSLAHARVAELAATLQTSDLSHNVLRTYWVVRPQRQVRWFLSSLERLERSHHIRGIYMAWTFIGAAVAGCVKLLALLFHLESVANIALFGLLVCIGLAGASSSAYLGQNQRSLKHRYAQQLRAIEEWTRGSAEDGLVRHLTGAGTVPQAAIVRDIRAFEFLMAVEMLDWVSISSDDAMELAAS